MESRTVFDTNIWISYMITAKYDELEAMLTNNVHFLRSVPSLEELQEVLSRKKFQKYKVDIAKTIAFYINLTEFCETKPLFNNCPDSKDNFLFDLALQGEAKYLISGDKKVLGTPLESKTLTLTTLASFKQQLSIQNIIQSTVISKLLYLNNKLQVIPNFGNEQEITICLNNKQQVIQNFGNEQVEKNSR